MQRTKAVQVFDKDLKDAISEVKKEKYRRELMAAHSSLALDIIENRVRADYQLTSDDRFQLMSEIVREIASMACTGMEGGDALREV